MASNWKTRTGPQTSIFCISSKREKSGSVAKKLKRKWKNSTISGSKFTRRLFNMKKKPKRSSGTTLGEKPLKGRKETAEPLKKSPDSLIVLLAAKTMAPKDPFTNTLNSSIRTYTNRRKKIQGTKAPTTPATLKKADQSKPHLTWIIKFHDFIFKLERSIW